MAGVHSAQNTTVVWLVTCCVAMNIATLWPKAKLCATSSVQLLRYLTNSSAFYMQWPMVRKMTRAHMIRLLKNGTYRSSLLSSHKKENITLPEEAKSKHSWKSFMHIGCISQKYAVPEVLSFFFTEDLFVITPLSVLLINMSVYFQKTSACEQLLNCAVEHATVSLKLNGLWLQLVSLSILKMGI